MVTTLHRLNLAGPTQWCPVTFATFLCCASPGARPLAAPTSLLAYSRRSRRRARPAEQSRALAWGRTRTGRDSQAA